MPIEMEKVSDVNSAFVILGELENKCAIGSDCRKDIISDEKHITNWINNLFFYLLKQSYEIFYLYLF